MKVNIIGLGKLGLPLAVTFASKGHEVIGVDSNVELVKRLNNKQCPYFETDLDKYLHDTNVAYTTTPSLSADLTFVIVPTPSGKDGRFSTTLVEQALEHLSTKNPVIIVSTVMPGDTRRLRAKYNLPLLYNPEFIALGSVIKDMLNPDSILIGEVSNEADTLVEFYHSIHSSPVYRMSYENAELSKLALNCYITTKITFANQLAELCESLPGGDVDKVTEFLGSDSRVAKKYLKSGLGFGGPCFPRDNIAFLSCFKSSISSAVVSYNKGVAKRVVDIAIDMIKDIHNPKITVLGMSYKPNTSVTTESDSLEIVRQVARFCAVESYDPSIASYTLKDSDLAIIATPWKEYEKLDMHEMRHKRVLDCWRHMKNKESCEMYRAIGIQF